MKRELNYLLYGFSYKEIIGVFKNAIEAAQAYDAKAPEIHGEKAKLNFPIK